MQYSKVNLVSSTKDFIECIYDDVYRYFYWQYWKEDRLFFTTIALMITIKLFIVNINLIPSGSMNPTLIEGDVVLVNKIKTWFTPAKRGDIVTFDRDKYMVKRVVALEGDTVQIVNSRLYLNGEAVAYNSVEKNNSVDMQFPIADVFNFQAFEVRFDNGISFNAVLPASEQSSSKHNAVLSNYLKKYEEIVVNTRLFVVPEGHLFVMGDNHVFSKDSRAADIHFVKEDEVVGQLSHTIVNIYRIWNNLMSCTNSKSKCMDLRLFK